MTFEQRDQEFSSDRTGNSSSEYFPVWSGTVFDILKYRLEIVVGGIERKNEKR